MTSKRLLLENSRKGLERHIKAQYSELEDLILAETADNFSEDLDDILEEISCSITKMLVLEKFLDD